MTAPFPTPHAAHPAVHPAVRPLTLAVAPSAVVAPRARPHAPATLDALLDALRSERRLLDELAATMLRQRAAVAADDLPAVDDSVFATHRILATLGQARVRRRQINRLLAGLEELPARDLDAVLGAQMTDDIRAARAELQASAGALAREVEVNRRVLRDALQTGDAHARVLAGAPAKSAAAPAGGVLLNRTA
jgi:hypothetical protein